MTTKTTAMDEGIERPRRVSLERHPYDFNDLASSVGQRIIATIQATPMGCHYFNPAVTVSCPEPTTAFFATVRKEQARWCRIAGKTIRKRNRRSVKSWVSHERLSDKYARYLDRAASFTGILFANGQLIPSHRWPKPQT